MSNEKQKKSPLKSFRVLYGDYHASSDCRDRRKAFRKALISKKETHLDCYIAEYGIHPVTRFSHLKCIHKV